MSKDIFETIKQLREETGAGVMACKVALEECGNFEKALQALKERGIASAAKKEGREMAEGLIGSYNHTSGKIGAIVKITCETDFVARTDDFKHLTHEIAMQVAATAPDSIESLLEQDYIRDPSKSVRDLLTETIAKLGENISIAQISRLEIN